MKFQNFVNSSWGGKFEFEKFFYYLGFLLTKG